MIQANLLNRTLRNTDSLPEMRSLLQKYSSTGGDLGFLKAVHVTGSKGKGSVCAMIESILRRGAGVKTGMFTSPHLVHPRERIRINGHAVSPDLFARHVLSLNERLQQAGEQVSFFRFLWMVAIEVFWEEGVQVGIVEVGIGGRYDATNVIDRPVVCAIGSLTMEHVGLLGPGIRDIAWNKAGIMKPGVPVFAVQQPGHLEAEAVLQQEAVAVGVDGRKVVLCPPLPEGIPLGIDGGQHQRRNAGLAQAVAAAWLQAQGLPPLSVEAVTAALREAKWPGRHQKHRLRADCWLYLDGCHTVESVQYCAEWFHQHVRHGHSNQQKRHLVFHCSLDRDFRSLLQPLIDEGVRFDSVAFVVPQHLTPGKDDPISVLQHHHAMAQFWSQSRVDAVVTVVDVLDRSFFDTLDGHVLVCGSLYLVGNVMGIFGIET